MTTTWMKKLTAGLALAVAIVGGSVSALAQKKCSGNQVTKFDPPGAGTAAGQGTFAQQGLNSGAIVGYYVDADGMAHGFVRSVNGNYTTFDVPGAAGTQAFGINDEGTVVGWWFEPPASNGSSVYHGYLRDKHGNLTYFDVPGAGPYIPQGPSPIVVIPLPLAINRDGTVAGSYVDLNNATVNHGFVRSVDGNITSFDPPGSVTTVGDTNGINREGAITGGYATADGVSHAYLRDPGGEITKFDAPGAGTGVGQGTYFNMITDAGSMPGVFIDQSNVSHGFLLSRDGTLVSIDVTGAGTGKYQGTLPSAANVAGIAAGNYFDSNGVSHGFVRSRRGEVTTFDVPGEGTGAGQGLAAVNSITKGGAAVGWYIDGNGAFHGYIYQYRGEDDSNVPGADHAGDRLSTSISSAQ